MGPVASGIIKSLMSVIIAWLGRGLGKFSPSLCGRQLQGLAHSLVVKGLPAQAEHCRAAGIQQGL
jgi:hypothetical protein